MLTFRMHSRRVSGGHVKLSVLAPDESNCYSITFAVEWTGWNRFQLEKDAFQDNVGRPSWADVQGLRFFVVEGPLPPTELRLTDVGWSSATPAWELEYGERMIEASYERTLVPEPVWQAVEEGNGEVGKTWSRITFKLRRSAEGKIAGSFWRPFNVDISDCQAVRVQVSIQENATLGMSARIDGDIITICEPQPGINNWEEFRGAIDGKALEALYLHCGEGNKHPPGDPPEEMLYTLHFVTLETNAFDPPKYPEQATKPLPPGLKTRQPLLEAGLPEWLYFGREDILAIRKKVQTGEHGLTWEGIINEAEQWLGDDPSVYGGGYWPTTGTPWVRPWYHRETRNRKWDSQACVTAFAYLLTEDMRYAEQARRYLLAASSLLTWNCGMISRHPVAWGGHAGPFAEATKGSAMVLVYNWIYNTLTDDERQTIEDSMLYKSWYWLNDYIDRAEYIRSMNQGPWFNWGALMHALILRRSHPFLDEHIEKYEANILENIDLCYLEDGSNTEGPGYWGATTRYIAYALPLLAHHGSRPIAEYVPSKFRRSIETPIYLRSLARDDFHLLAINDSKYRQWEPGATLPFFATLLEEPLARWATSEVDLNRTLPEDSFDIGRLLEFFWFNRSGDVPRPNLLLSRQFSGSAGTVFRSGWDTGDILFCMQTGEWGNGHQHSDKNSFVLEAYCERLCPDAGVGPYAGATAASPKATRSHNAITINGANQKPAHPRILKCVHGMDCDIVESDVTANYPMATKVLRRVLFKRPRYFVVSDEVETAESSSIEFNLHTFSTISIDDNSAFFEGEKANMIVKVVASDAVRLDVISTPHPSDDGNLNRLQIRPERPVKSIHYLTILYPLRKDEERPIITNKDAEASVAIHVENDVVIWTDEEGLRLR